jgi:hypothetical protein
MLTLLLLNVSPTGMSYDFRMMILSFHQHSIPPNIDLIELPLSVCYITKTAYIKKVYETTHFNSQTYLMANEQSVRVVETENTAGPIIPILLCCFSNTVLETSTQANSHIVSRWGK